MSKFRIDKWTTRQVINHTKSLSQTINHHHINIVMFGFVWKRAFSWHEYIDTFGET